jgi:hypothetical protein
MCPDRPRQSATRRGNLGLLVLLAAAVRVAYGFEYAALPFYWGPVFDALVYERQAQAVLALRFGDPTLLAYSPLYGYFLALFGANPGLVPFVAQMAMGVATLVLIHRTAARLSLDERAGDVAFLLALGYGMLRFYETKLMSETLGLFLLASSLWVMSTDRCREGRPAASIATGALLGLAVLARASLLFVAALTPPLFLLAWRRGEPGRPRLARAGFTALGLGLVLLLNGGWNFLHTGLFVPVILVSDTVSRMNDEGSSGTFDEAAGDDGVVSVWDVVRQAEAKIHAHGGASRQRNATTSNEGQTSTGAAIHIDASTFVANLPAKLASTLRDVETTYDYGYYGERTELTSWLFAPISFGALALLGACGALWDLRKGRRVVARMAPLIVGVVVTTTLFYPTSRYRLPIALAFVLLAAPFVVGLARATRGGRGRGLAAALVIACVGFGVALER